MERPCHYGPYNVQVQVYIPISLWRDRVIMDLIMYRYMYRVLLHVQNM